MSLVIPRSLPDAELLEIFQSNGLEELGLTFLAAGSDAIGCSIREGRDPIAGRRVQIGSHVEFPVFEGHELEAGYVIDLARVPATPWWPSRPGKGWLVAFVIDIRVADELDLLAAPPQRSPGFTSGPAQLRVLAEEDVRIVPDYTRTEDRMLPFRGAWPFEAREYPVVTEMPGALELPSSAVIAVERALHEVDLPVDAVIGGLGRSRGYEPLADVEAAGVIDEPVTLLMCTTHYDDGVGFFTDREGLVTGDHRHGATMLIYN